MNSQIEIRQYDGNDWNELIKNSEQMSFQQLFEYGEAKEKTTNCSAIRQVFWRSGSMIGASQAISRTLPWFKKGVVWISRGPLILRSDETAPAVLMTEMLKSLKKYWVDEKKMYLRILPAIYNNEQPLNIYTDDEYKLSDKHGWASIRLDLTKSVDELFKSLRSRWRRYFKKLAEQNVLCYVSSVLTELEILLDDYDQLIKRKQFEAAAISIEFLRHLQNLLPTSNKMLIFIAQRGDHILGRLLVVRYGRSAMTYIIGNNAAGQDLHINHFLYWEAIKEMKKQGYKWFDLGGANSHTTPPGILHFKQGFNGRPYQLCNEIEAYPNSLIYKFVRKIVSKKRQ